MPQVNNTMLAGLGAGALALGSVGTIIVSGNDSVQSVDPPITAEVQDVDGDGSDEEVVISEDPRFASRLPGDICLEMHGAEFCATQDRWMQARSWFNDPSSYHWTVRTTQEQVVMKPRYPVIRLNVVGFNIGGDIPETLVHEYACLEPATMSQEATEEGLELTTITCAYTEQEMIEQVISPEAVLNVSSDEDFCDWYTPPSVDEGAAPAQSWADLGAVNNSYPACQNFLEVYGVDPVEGVRLSYECATHTTINQMYFNRFWNTCKAEAASLSNSSLKKMELELDMDIDGDGRVG